MPRHDRLQQSSDGYSCNWRLAGERYTFTFHGTAVLNGPVMVVRATIPWISLGYGTAVSASPTGTGSGNVSGTPDPITYAAGDDYTGMENVITSGALSGPDGQDNIWDITGLNQFTLNGTTYSGVSAVLGGNQVDTFTIENNGRLDGGTGIDGGAGVNVLQSVGNATWALTGANAGSITTTGGATTFTNIQTLTGGIGTDDFTVSGTGSLSGAINGGLTGANSLTGNNLASSVDDQR